jgi:hypothetical protein
MVTVRPGGCLVSSSLGHHHQSSKSSIIMETIWLMAATTLMAATGMVAKRQRQKSMEGEDIGCQDRTARGPTHLPKDVVFYVNNWSQR